MLARVAVLAALFPFAAAAAPSAIEAPTSASTPPVAGFDQHSAKAEALSSTTPWWEKLVVTVGDEGDAQSCVYQTSLDPGTSLECDVETDGPASASAGAALPEQMTHITFERRFSPVASLADSEVAAGDTLLGKSVLALAIDKDGRVRGCKVVASGGTRPDYSCKEAAAEKFEAAASAESKPLRVATLTILVYAHDEDYV